jgi:tetratricopeptide (TPR) repeat protein
MLQSGYERCGWAAFFTAFIWLVHPLQTQSVVYVVQRMNSLAAMFYLLSMLLYVRFRLNRGGYGNRWVICGCVLSGLLAIGSKQISATLPIFILLYEWFFFQKLEFKWSRRHIFFLSGLVTLVILISFFYLGQNPIDRILSAYSYRDFTLTQRILTQFRVVVFYIGLLLWPQPSRLNLDHDFTLSYSLMNPVTTLISMMIIICLGGLAILIARKDPLVSFGIFWFFGNLVIESSVIGLELVFEHRNYLPSMFLILAMVSLVLRLVKPAWLASVILCLIGALLIVWTFERNKVWGDELSLYRDSAEKSPAKARPHNNLGSILLRRNRLPEAIDEFRRALNLKQDYADAHYNLGNALVKQGNLTEGIYHYMETLRLRPRNVKALNNLAATLTLKKRYDEAILYLKEALGINPKDPDLHNNIAILFKRQGNLAEARHHFMKTLEISPNRESARLSLSEIERQLQKTKDIEEIKEPQKNKK